MERNINSKFRRALRNAEEKPCLVLAFAIYYPERQLQNRCWKTLICKDQEFEVALVSGTPPKTRTQRLLCHANCKV